MNISSILNNRIEFAGVFTFYHFDVLWDIFFQQVYQSYIIESIIKLLNLD